MKGPRTSRLAAVILAVAAAIAAPARANDDDAVQELVFFGPLRPVYFRLHLYVDGQPFRQVWREHAEAQFRSIDANGDGLIDAGEAAQARPTLAALAANQGTTGDAALARFVKSAGGQAAIQDCLRWQERSADGPFSITESTAAALSDGALLALIDRDRDGRLSRDELAGAIDVLRRRDFDQDEVLTRPELILGEALYESVAASEAIPASDPAVNDKVNATAGGVDQAPSRFVHVLHPGASPIDAAQAILARYDRNRDGLLSGGTGAGRELALDEPTWAALDKNGDRLLDADELIAFIERGPSVELVFQFGRLSSEIDLMASRLASALQGDDDAESGAGLRVRTRNDGSYRLELPDARVEIRRDNRHPTKNRPQDFNFRAFDTDGNRYLDAKEAQRLIGAAPLALIDADGDQMATEKEFDEFLTREGDAAGTRLVLALTGEGQNLFEQIDANLDGGLTPRELRMAADQLATLDANQDGYLDPDELPHQVTLLLARGRLRLPTASDSAAMRRPRGAVRVEEEAGPSWFRKMDRNRDGDVSPREFLGSAELFRQLDANGDGLIDADEAEAYRAGE